MEKSEAIEHHAARKQFNLKHVRKYALKRFKHIRDPNNQKSHNEPGTSASASTSSTFSLQATTTTSKAVDTIIATSSQRNSSKPPGSTPFSSVKYAEYQRRLLHHQYTDVIVEHIQLNDIMAEEKNTETKPLTQPLLTAKPKIQPQYDVHRDVVSHDVVIKKTGYGARDKSIPHALRQCWEGWSFLSLFTGIIPILQWLPKYSLKRDLLGDLVAGFTVAIMHIPHGMAYGLLAGVSPGNGMYMSIFPPLVYMILGTSRHISIGTFAVISMMTLKVVQTYATDDSVIAAVLANGTAEGAPGVTAENIITPVEVVTSLALCVGLVHLLMGLFRMGTLSSLLSDPLVNGFTTGAACHVVTSQLKDVLGVTVPRYKGAFKIVYTLIDLCKSLPKTNIVALVFCVGIMVFMTICNECLKPCLRKRCRFPLPAELIAVIGGTLISMFCDVNGNYNVALVGEIPTGLPPPEMPRLDLVPLVIVDSIAIAIVSYSIVMSMGITFAKKHSYEIRPNQELFALGMGNFVGGCFSCIPLACSLSRSIIQEQTGGATQLASLVSAILIIMTLLWAGPFFASLPRCVLAGVIIVALKPMFMQAKELKKFAKQGKLELLTWIFTFLCVVIIDIDIGLLIGVAISVLALYIKGLKPYAVLLGIIPDTPAVYVDMNHHRNAVEVPETKIFRYVGSLNFATGMFYRRRLYEALGMDAQRIRRPSYMPMQPQPHQNGKGNDVLSTLNVKPFRCLIIDFSMLGHIDVAGCRTLTEIMKELNARDIRLFVASPSDRVYDTLVHSMALGEGPFEIFPTLHDAVEYSNACRTV